MIGPQNRATACGDCPCAVSHWPIVSSPRSARRRRGGQSTHRPENAEAIAQAEVLVPQQGGQEVQGGGKPADAAEIAAPPLGSEEMECVAAAEGVGHVHPPAEVQEVGAAAHRQVLAEVDELPGRRIVKAAGASAEAGGLFEQFDAASLFHRGRGGSDSRQAPADHGDARQGSGGSGGEGGVVHFEARVLYVGSRSPLPPGEG